MSDASIPPSTLTARQLRRLLLPMAATVGVTFGAVLYGFSVLITTHAAGAAFSSALLSSAYAGSILAGGAIAVWVGRWTGAHGVRGVLAVGGGLVAAGLAAFAMAQAPWQVLAAWWLLIGPGTAMTLFDPAFIAIEQWCDRAQRNRAAGVLTLTTGLAGPIFVPATTFAVSAVGWRGTAAGLGVVVAATAWLTAGWALASAPSPRSVADGPRLRITALARSPRFVVITAAVVLLVAALESAQVHRIAVFEASGFNPVWLAAWAAGASLASLPGRIVVPQLATRWGGVAMLVVSIVVLVPAFAAAIGPTATWQVATHFGVFGLAFGATLPLRAVVMGDWYGGASYGALMGVQALAIAVGRALGPAGVGWSATALGSYAPAMAVLTGATALAALLTAVSPRLRSGLELPPR